MSDERCRVQLRQKDGELAQRDQVARADAVQLAPLLCSILQDLSKFFIETKSRSLEYVLVYVCHSPYSSGQYWISLLDQY